MSVSLDDCYSLHTFCVSVALLFSKVETLNQISVFTLSSIHAIMCELLYDLALS